MLVYVKNTRLGEVLSEHQTADIPNEEMIIKEIAKDIKMLPENRPMEIIAFTSDFTYYLDKSTLFKF